MKNEPLHKTREILAAHDYHRIASEVIPRNPDDSRHDQTLEWWSGPKGVVIVSSEDPKDGCLTYADWTLGHTFNELKEALK